MPNKMTRFPYNPDYKPTEDDNFLLDEEGSPESTRMIFQTLLSILKHTEPDGERIAPDKYGCYCTFSKAFLTNELDYDFPHIAKAFLTHERENIDTFTRDFCIVDENADATPYTLFCTHVLGLMICALASGNEFTRQLLFNVIKTYYREDYKVLKRFRSISAREVVDMALTADNEYSIVALGIARLLVFCEIMNIDIQPGCDSLYTMLNTLNDRYEDFIETNAYLSINQELQQECIKWVEEQDAERKASSSRSKDDKFYFYACELCNLTFKRKGFAENFAEIISSDRDRSHNMAMVRMIMKEAHPKVDFTYSELQLLAQLYFIVCCLCDYADEADDIFGQIIGIYDCDDFGDSLWNDSIIPQDTTPISEKKPERVIPLPAVNPTLTPLYKEEDLMDEINSLRARLHKKNADYDRLRDMYTAQKTNLQEVSSSTEKFKLEHEELIALRNHVYNSTEKDIPLSAKTPLPEVKALLLTKKIILIGGHVNWMKKLRSLFPNWTCIEPRSSGTIDPKILNHADHVYFFTDYINHSMYYRFMQIVRDHQLPFGYIHSVNIETVMRQLYQDLK